MSEETVNKEEQKETPSKGQTPVNMGFGITEETQDSNAIKVLPPIKKKPTDRFPSGYHFPIVSLVNVVAKENFKTKNGETEVIQFIFRGEDGRQHVRTEWAQDPSEEKYMARMDALNIRINHMYRQIYASMPEGGIGTGTTDFFSYFKAIEEAFKANKDVSKMKFYLKLVWFSGNLDIPYAPNFLEKVIKDKACGLEINLKYDKIEQSTPTSAGIPGIGSKGGDDDIDFDQEYN